MKSNKSSSFHKKVNENIFEDRVLLATAIEDITRLGERIDSLEKDQVLVRQFILRMLKEEHTERHKEIDNV